MQTHNLIQGSPEWHEHRATHFNASDAPAMMGVSPFLARSELLLQKHTGITPEVDPGTQKRFDDGHRFEALARILAEEIVGDDLYPVTVSNGKYSASMDGLNMGSDISFEHKSLNDAIRAATSAAELPEYLRVQMEHQFIASPGTTRCLFMASKWDDQDKLLEKKYFWYESDVALRDRIVDGWARFEKDLAEYVPIIHSEKPHANAIMQLPALAVQIRGEVLTSNLPAFTKAAEHFLANIKTDLQTDTDFADAEETVKFCDRAEKELELAKKAAIEQTVDIAELMRTIDYVKDELRSKRLMLDRLVKTQKEAIKSQILADARLKFADHLAAIEAEIKPIRLVYQQPDFQGAIKNKRTLASLHDAVDSALANAKIATDATAKDIRAKLAWYKENAVGYEVLFADLDRVIYKQADDFQMLVRNRIDQHKLEEKRKLEAERVRIQAEEQKKAEEKVRAEQQAELLKKQKELEVVQAELVAGQKPVPVIAQAPEAPKPALVKTDPKQAIVERTKPILITLARRELDDFRSRYSGIPELVMVMEEIESFMIATAPREEAKA